MKIRQIRRFFGNKFPLFIRSLFNRQTPWGVRLLILATLAYVILPADFLPAFLVGPLGWIDDAILLPLMVVWTVSLLPQEMKQKALTA